MSFASEITNSSEASDDEVSFDFDPKRRPDQSNMQLINTLFLDWVSEQQSLTSFWVVCVIDFTRLYMDDLKYYVFLFNAP